MRFVSIALIILTALIASLVTPLSLTKVFANDQGEIYFFYGNGCPHCATVEQFFDERGYWEKYDIQKKEVYFDRENAVLYNKVLSELGVSTEKRGVPTVIIGSLVLTGDRPIMDQFATLAEKYRQSEVQKNPEGQVQELATTSAQADTVPPENAVSAVGTNSAIGASDNDLPVGRKNMQSAPQADAQPAPAEATTKEMDAGLTILAVVLASLVDAINPCAFAVLIILMSTILSSGNSKKALKAGLAFSTSIFISYVLMGLGLYHALSWSAAFSGWIFLLVGWLAILLGLANLKDFFWYGKGFLMEVPTSWRPKMKSIIHSVTSPGGAFFVGFIVSLFLLPCTSGPYIVILGMLAQHPFNARAIGYLLLYNIIFVAPMVLITAAVYKGYDPQKAEAIRQKRLRILHLVAGLLLITLGTYLLIT